MQNINRSVSNKWVTLFVISVGTFLNTYFGGAVRMSLPHIGQYFEVGTDSVVWVSLITSLVCTGLMLTMGKVGDAFGRKKLYRFGLLIVTFGLGLCSLSQSLVQLVVFRFIHAVGMAMTIAMGTAIITNAFPPQERGKALGIMGAVVAFGQLSGPVVGGLLLDLFGWRSLFYLFLPFGILALVLVSTLLKEQFPPKRGDKFDLPGAATFFFALTCLLLAATQGRSLGFFSPWFLGLLVMGLLLLSLFLILELRAEQPVLDLRLFSSRLFSVASASQLLAHASTSAVAFLMPFYLIQGLGFGASMAGLMLVTIPALSLVFSPLSGRLSDKLGTLFLCALGLTLACVGFFLLTRLSDHVSVGYIVLSLSVIGVGMAIFVPPNMSAIMGSMPNDKLGTASAMLGTLRMVGVAVGLALAGGIFAASKISHAHRFVAQGLGQDAIYRLSTVKAFDDAVVALLLLSAIALVVSLLRGRK